MACSSMFWSGLDRAACCLALVSALYAVVTTHAALIQKLDGLLCVVLCFCGAIVLCAGGLLGGKSLKV